MLSVVVSQDHRSSKATVEAAYLVGVQETSPTNLKAFVVTRCHSHVKVTCLFVQSLHQQSALVMPSVLMSSVFNSQNHDMHVPCR